MAAMGWVEPILRRSGMALSRCRMVVPEYLRVACCSPLACGLL
jgi:hypothetical protein